MKNSASSFMDKQIMDLSRPHIVTDGEEKSLVDILGEEYSRPSEKNGDILASYDFMPIRQALGSTTTGVADVDTGDVDTARRKWNSFETKSDAPSIRSYNALDADQSAKFSTPNTKNSDAPLNVVVVSEIEKILKKNMENLTHSIDTMSARISQLETRTRNLENSIDELKDSVHNNHGSSDGRMRLLENILNEVRTSVGFIKDKQEVMEAQLQIAAKLQAPPVKKDESSNTAVTDPTQRPSGNQHFSSFPPAQPPQPLPPLPPPPQNQNLQPPFQPPARESYIPPSNQPPEIPAHYQVSTPQPQPHPQVQSVQFPQQQSQQYQSPSPLPQYPRQAPSSQPPQAMPSQPPPPFSAANPSVMVPFSQHPEEAASYVPPQTYPPTMNPPSSHPPPQQSYGPGPTPNLNAYFPVPNRPGPGFPGPYGPPGGAGEPYPNPYNNPQSQYGSTPHMKPQQHPSTHPQLPTARILPEALPTAAPIGSSSRPGGSGSNIPTEDVVNRVANMGFPRDQVRDTVRKLSEEGHAIDLNIVLDRLMNGGEGQPQRGWYGR